MLAISVSHYLTPASYFHLHLVYQRLYYLPILFGAFWFEQLAGIVQTGIELLQHEHDFFQPGPVLAELLCPLRIIPYIRLLEFANDLLEFFFSCSEVKDTPLALRSAHAGH